MYTDADEVQLLPKDKAVCCSVCNFQYQIISAYIITEKSGKQFEKKL
jgi:hypothetical protein